MTSSRPSSCIYYGLSFYVARVPPQQRGWSCPPYDIIPRRIIPYHIMLYHMVSYHTALHHTVPYIISYRVISYRITSYHYHITSHIVPYHIDVVVLWSVTSKTVKTKQWYPAPSAVGPRGPSEWQESAETPPTKSAPPAGWTRRSIPMHPPGPKVKLS